MEKEMVDDNARFSLLLEMCDDAIVEFDKNRRIVSWNKAAEAIYSYSKDEVLGKPGSMLYFSDKFNEADKLVERLINKEKIKQYGWIGRKKNGEKVILSITLSAIYDISGNLLGFLAIGKDITQNKSHMQQPKDTRDGIRHAIELANSNIIEDKSFNLIGTIEEIISEISGVCCSKGIKVWNYFDPKIADDLIGDEYRLKHVLRNLADNAVKFIHSGNIVFSVRKLTQENSKVKLLFSVEDTGTGISESYKEELFRTLAQEAEMLTEDYYGTRHGLAISKKLVNQMNGEIWFESELDKGTVFYFTAEFLF